MLSRRIATAPALRSTIPTARRIAFYQRRGAAQASSGPDYPSLVSASYTEEDIEVLVRAHG